MIKILFISSPITLFLWIILNHIITLLLIFGIYHISKESLLLSNLSRFVWRRRTQARLPLLPKSCVLERSKNVVIMFGIGLEGLTFVHCILINGLLDTVIWVLVSTILSFIWTFYLLSQRTLQELLNFFRLQAGLFIEWTFPSDELVAGLVHVVVQERHALFVHGAEVIEQCIRNMVSGHP